MANNNLLKKIAPVVLSATVAMTGMPSAAFAAEFSDEEVVLDERAEDEATDVEIEDTEVDAAEDEADITIEDAEENTEDTEADTTEETSGAEDVLAQRVRQMLLRQMVKKLLLKVNLYMVQQTFRMPISFMVK